MAKIESANGSYSGCVDALATALAGATAPAEIARRHGVKASTVRSQLLVVLRKMDVHRQADVTRLLLSDAQAPPF